MNEEIKKFLQMVVASREAGLMVVEENEEMEELEQEVSDFGFQKSQNVRELFNNVKNGEKTYFILTNELGNNIYNILSQYPTGQINAYDGKNNLVANPNYQTGAILILITNENIREIEKKGKDLLKVVGLTWRKKN